jgi:hypothetical protein
MQPSEFLSDLIVSGGLASRDDMQMAWSGRAPRAQQDGDLRQTLITINALSC